MTDYNAVGPLRQALQRLAEQPERQAQYLADLGVGGQTDELALEFDDAYQPVREWLSGEMAFGAVWRACEQLDAALADDALSWESSSLSDAGWAAIRELAARALAAWARDIES